MEEEKKVIIVATDGGADIVSWKPYVANTAACIIVREYTYNDKAYTLTNEIKKSLYLPNSTHNVAELTSYGMGMDFILESAIPETIPVVFVLDSEYTRKAINIWYNHWIKTEVEGIASRRLWKSNKYIPVKNWDLIKMIRAKYDELDASPRYVLAMHVHSHIKSYKEQEKERLEIAQTQQLEISQNFFKLLLQANIDVDALCTQCVKENKK